MKKPDPVLIVGVLILFGFPLVISYRLDDWLLGLFLCLITGLYADLFNKHDKLKKRIDKLEK